MEEHDRSQFAAALSVMAIGLGVKRDEVTETMLDFYWDALSDLQLPDVLCALDRLKKTLEWMPKPVVIRNAAGVLSPEDMAIVAWEQVLSTLNGHGHNYNVDFEDRAINAAIRSIGGWVELCRSDQDWLLRFGQARFRTAYLAAQQQGFPDELGKPLRGGNYDVRPMHRVPASTPHQLPEGQRRAALTDGGARSNRRSDQDPQPGSRPLPGRSGGDDEHVGRTIAGLMQRVEGQRK